MKKKFLYRFLLLLLISLFSFSLYASCSLWIGTGFISNKTYLDETEKQNFKTMLADFQNLKNINYIGPTLDIMFIPYNSIPIGLKLATQPLFPVGYNGTQDFRTFHGDLKNKTMVSLAYADTFSDTFGLTVEMGYEYDYYRIEKTNQQNTTNKSDYTYFDNHALFGEICLLTTMPNAYFKFGCNYSHSIINTSQSYDFIFSGGFKFS